MKKFIYNVNGVNYNDTQAFGDAWRKAFSVAKSTNSKIIRNVITDDEARVEFFAKGGVFLNMRFYEESKVYKF